MTKDIQDTKMTPTEFTLSGVKRKTIEDLELTYATGKTTIHVPFKKGETQFVLHRRRDTLAQIALEGHLRVTAFCMWSNYLLSFRFDPKDRTLIHDTHQQKRYSFGNKQPIQLVVSRQTCAMSAFVGRGEKCRNCVHPHWRASCLNPSFIRHILPAPTSRGQHHLCDQTLEWLGPLPIDTVDSDPWLKRLPTCNVRVCIFSSRILRWTPFVQICCGEYLAC
mmetsp:Transcript_24189/g.52149  ORF Transcript_24189/g.52149 Transcript_24189/m.52149 type:complete len:221 (-) Transcript_24189:361-1023(-)